MLKRNLIVIATIVLGLGITSAFGQPTSVRKGTIKKPTSGKVMRDGAQGQSTGIKARRTSKGTSGSSSRIRKPERRNIVWTWVDGSIRSKSKRINRKVRSSASRKKP